MATEYLNFLGDKAEDTFLPMTTIIEFDLVLKGRRYTSGQRRAAFSWFSYLVPENRIIPISAPSSRIAMEVQERD